jgi:cell division protein FtsB
VFASLLPEGWQVEQNHTDDHKDTHNGENSVDSAFISCIKIHDIIIPVFMAQFKKKNEYHFWHSPLVLIALFCLVVLFAYNTVGLVQKDRQTAQNKADELNKIADLKSRQQALSSDIANLQTPEGKEEAIRDKFQVVKPGEQMVVIVDDPNATPAPSDTSMNQGFWGFIKKIFHIQ